MLHHRGLSRPAQTGLAALLVLLLMTLTSLVPLLVEAVPDAGSLLRDATAVAEVPAWVGSMSRLINLLWAAAATVLLISARVAPSHRRGPLVMLGILTAVLTLDDTLMIHEDLLPLRGIPEGVVLSGYAVLGSVIAARWWRDRRTAAGGAVFVGGALLALSVVVDALSDDMYVLEDTAKVLGVVAWLFSGLWALDEGLAARRDVPTG